MSFAAPIWLAAAALVGAGVLIAHLFSPTVPPQGVLPTVRFIPEGAPLTVLRSRTVSDWLLLILRLLAVALLGFAFAGAHLRRRAPERVVVVDVSRAVASISTAADSAIPASRGGRLIAFDTVARSVPRDSLRALGRTNARGSLSAALLAAHRLVADVPDDRDRTELVIVSPLVREEVDSATSRLLDLWAGPVRVVRVAAASAPAAPGWELRAEGDDPVAAALGAATHRGPAALRIVRMPPTPADSQWANAGGILVVWPARDEARALPPRAAPDSQGGIAAPRDVAIAPFARRFQPRPGRVLLRWADGEAAATEHAFGRGCIREVAIPVDAVGDLSLRASFRGIVASLLPPCEGAPDLRPVANEELPGASARAPERLAAAGRERNDQGALPLWLAIAGAAVLLAEQLLRTRGRAAA
jgi:hypothetical protein